MQSGRRRPGHETLRRPESALIVIVACDGRATEPCPEYGAAPLSENGACRDGREVSGGRGRTRIESVPRRIPDGHTVRRTPDTGRKTMFKRALLPTCVAVVVAACGGTAQFSPDPGTYTESSAAIEGVEGQRAIASIDSTFFGRNMPMLGRMFSAQEHAAGSPVAILSNTFWMERFGGRPDVIGSEIEVGGEVRRIVGVMPGGVDVPSGVALWIPRS
jgi:hypothetical protein